MKDKKMEQLKREYMDIDVPKELDFVVRNALKERGINTMNKRNGFKAMRIAAASIAACFTMLIAGTNTSQAFAETMSKVPVLGNFVKVVTFREYNVAEDNFQANIKVPEVQGLENKALESSLNKKYLEENKILYEQFMADMKELEKKGEAHVAVDSGYEVKTDNDTIFSVERYVTTIAGSSDTQKKFDTIDKKKQILITLPSLFKNEGYVEVISQNIIGQMREQGKSDENKVYWIDKNVEDGLIEAFKSISKEQSFYINKDGKLVISFDKYEVGPGCMGAVEFVIPTEAVKDILVGNEYIK